jgi:hypothetical protein
MRPGRASALSEHEPGTYPNGPSRPKMPPMNVPASITVTPVHVADLHVEGELMPVYVHLIDHPDGRVLVDTGMTELHPCWPTWIPCSGR